MTFYEVVFDHPDFNRPPFGISFHDEATADRFAARLKEAGYSVEQYPGCETTETAAEALQAASLFFGDPRLSPEGPKQ